MISPPTNAQPIKLLWYNTFLLHGFSIGNSRQIFAKPHLTHRARELGIQLQKLASPTPHTPSIFALCEVFSPKTFALIHNQLNPSNSPHTSRYASGPTAGLPHPSQHTSPHFPAWIRHILNASRGKLPIASGLYTLTNHLPITRTATHTFQYAPTDPTPQSPSNPIDWNALNRGHPLRDPDFWANKGILLTEIDLGPGKIELYSTHLFSGQPFSEAFFPSLQKLSHPFKKHLQFFNTRPPQRLLFQRGQLQQIVDFILHHHRPENTVILAGDFNLNAHDPLSLALLSQTIDKLKAHGIHLQDTRHAFQAKPDTCTTIIPNDLLFHPDPPTPFPPFCSPDHPNPQWLDYIFIQKQEAQHTCSIHIIDHALRPFAHPTQSNQNMNFLSDHIGLEITLRASPKPC